MVVCIGIGGSYLGAKAVLEAMSDPFKLLHKEQKDPTVIFAGQNISEDYTAELLAALKEHSIAAIVISKSGTTTEPAIAFRLIKAEIEKRYGKKEAAERIVAITDKARGALKTLATQEGYPTFVIPDDVGGRFSVLTPVGLLPLAVAGVDIAALVRGAQEMEKATAEGVAFKENPAAVYAAVRNILYNGGKKIEILGSYEPKLQYINEWWKQLYGESEGKQGKGIFPASVTLTADLHSMGQYIQDGERTLFETIISVAKPAAEVLIEADGEFSFGKGDGCFSGSGALGLYTGVSHRGHFVAEASSSTPQFTQYDISISFLTGGSTGYSRSSHEYRPVPACGKTVVPHPFPQYCWQN